ncbi:hypothetical protein L484_006486 [Morus notabilis]|uniref:Photosynthetic NDH subunit of subcomplex B 4 n=1 Tax=Morus notabilis TaxID=981085 RepID=W9R4G6_9ROSA|nr:photosynthetic NDH subunit of subcomplex B 4, chloroplastic [Morus notabilis]EXB54326.1 hypothetical protein L484_006486 [Morus notabilis]
MAKAVIGFTIVKPRIHCSTFQTTCSKSLRQFSSSGLFSEWQREKGKRGRLSKANALPDLPLMAVLVEKLGGQMDYVMHKTIWHLSDDTIKNVYVGYIFFTCWGCLVFGSMKDPYYDSEAYRKDGGDGTGHWIYEKQEDIEETARSELWREELIEEIEQKVGGLRELEEAGKK